MAFHITTVQAAVDRRHQRRRDACSGPNGSVPRRSWDRGSTAPPAGSPRQPGAGRVKFGYGGGGPMEHIQRDDHGFRYGLLQIWVFVAPAALLARWLVSLGALWFWIAFLSLLAASTVSLWISVSYDRIRRAPRKIRPPALLLRVLGYSGALCCVLTIVLRAANGFEPL